MISKINIYIFYSLILFLSVFPFIKNITNENLIILFLPYIVCAIILLIISYNFIKNLSIKYFFFIFLTFIAFILNLYFINHYTFFIFKIITSIFLIFGLFILIKFNKNKNHRKIMLIDYLFILYFFIAFILSIKENLQDDTAYEIVNGLLNFRYYIFNSIFYLYARYFLIDKKNINVIITIFLLTSFFIFLYNFFEYFLLFFNSNINDIKWFYVSLISKGYFPFSLFDKSPFIYTNFIPLGINYNRHLSGFLSFFCLIFLIIYLFYFFQKTKKIFFWYNINIINFPLYFFMVF